MAEQTEDGIVVWRATFGAPRRRRVVPYNPDAVRLTLDAGAVEVGEEVLAAVDPLLSAFRGQQSSISPCLAMS